jgi:outer membrane lipopolysaccharide assembly protein LptE/RlpB
MTVLMDRSISASKNRYSAYLRPVAIVAVLLCLTACGYRFTGSGGGSRLAPQQTLWVSFIDSPSAQIVLRRALLDECHALRGITPSGSAAAADLRISGILKSYSNRPMSYLPDDQVKEYRLTIEAELELFRKGETVPLWKGVLKSHQDYPANSNLALQRNAEEAALSAASHIMAQNFLMAVEHSY